MAHSDIIQRHGVGMENSVSLCFIEGASKYGYAWPEKERCEGKYLIYQYRI